MIFVGFRYASALQTNQGISDDERAIGLFLKNHSDPDLVYGFEYRYFDTIRYYSEGRDIQLLKNDSVISDPFFMVITRLLYDHGQFPQEILPLLEEEYVGNYVVLLKFNPALALRR